MRDNDDVPDPRSEASGKLPGQNLPLRDEDSDLTLHGTPSTIFRATQKSDQEPDDEDSSDKPDHAEDGVDTKFQEPTLESELPQDP